MARYHSCDNYVIWAILLAVLTHGAEMSDNKSNGYFGTLAAAAPAFAVKSVVGDLPKGSVEFTIQHKLMQPKSSTKSLLLQGMRGRGAGRAAGGLAGVITAPVYLKSIQLLGSKDGDERRKGLLLNLGSTAGYAGIKGMSEGAIESFARKDPIIKAMRSGAGLALAKVPMKLAPAAFTAVAIAKGRQRDGSGKEPGFSKKYIMPVLVGATTGATSRMGESVLQTLGSGGKLRVKPLAALGAGAAVGGALGAAVVSKVTDHVLKKTSSLESRATKLAGLFGLRAPLLRATPKALRAHMPYPDAYAYKPTVADKVRGLWGRDMPRTMSALNNEQSLYVANSERLANKLLVPIKAEPVNNNIRATLMHNKRWQHWPTPTAVNREMIERHRVGSLPGRTKVRLGTPVDYSGLSDAEKFRRISADSNRRFMSNRLMEPPMYERSQMYFPSGNPHLPARLQAPGGRNQAELMERALWGAVSPAHVPGLQRNVHGGKWIGSWSIPRTSAQNSVAVAPVNYGRMSRDSFAKLRSAQEDNLLLNSGNVPTQPSPAITNPYR